MRFNSLHEALQFRINNDDLNHYTLDYWKAIIQLTTKDLSETMRYIKESCNDEEFYWFSEVFEDIVSVDPRQEWITAFQERLSKVTRESYIQSSCQNTIMRKSVDYETYVKDVSMNIDFAKESID